MSCFNFKEEDELPKILEDDKIREYFEEYQSGYVTAKNLIAEHNLKLVYFITKKFMNTGYDFEELVSVGTIGLLKSIDTFNLSKGIKFSTYATRCIENEILMFLRKNKKHKCNKSFDEIISRDQTGKVLKIEDILYDDSSDFVLDYENLEIYRVVREVVENLPDREKEIIMLYFGFYDGRIYTQKQISKKLGVSQAQISRLKMIILEKIRKKLISYRVIDVLESDSVSNKELLYGIEDTKRYYN